MNYYQYQTVLGLLTICEENDAVIASMWDIIPRIKVRNVSRN